MIGSYFVNITAQIYRIYRDLFVKYHMYGVFVKVRRRFIQKTFHTASCMKLKVIVIVIFSVPMTVRSWINMNATKKFKIKGDSLYAFCGFLKVRV